MSTEKSYALREFFTKFHPKINSTTGEIRMRCVFPEKHDSEESRNNPQSFQIYGGCAYYRCWSCGSRGRVLNLLQTKFKLDYDTAFSMSGIPEYRETSMEEELYGEDVYPDDDSLPKYEGMSLTFDNPPPEFLRRGFTRQTLAHFKVGTCVETYTNKKGEEVTRRFATVPIMEGSKLIGVSLREFPKSFSYRPTGIEKSRYIYNEPEGDTILLTEGFTSCWRSFQNGIVYSSCVEGSEVPIAKLLRIGRRYANVIVAFDNDKAGVKGAERVYHTLFDRCEVTFVSYEGADPGEVTDAAYWRKRVVNALTRAEYVQEMESLLGASVFRKLSHDVQLSILREKENE